MHRNVRQNCSLCKLLFSSEQNSFTMITLLRLVLFTSFYALILSQRI